MKKAHVWLLVAAVILGLIGFMLGWLDNGPRTDKTTLSASLPSSAA